MSDKLDYHIIGTGSSGNAVRIENLMFDCGLPYAHMKEELYNCDALLITHAHTDHIKPSTFTKIRTDFPNIKIYANYDVAYQFENITNIINEGIPFHVYHWLITPFECSHDIPCHGFVMQQPNLNVIYATDTSSLDNALKIKYDYLFLESNYDEDKLNMIAKTYETRGYDPWIQAHRHLSNQQCRTFYYLNRKSKSSKLIELHQSKRFY